MNNQENVIKTEKKICSKCKKEKPLDNFYLKPDRKYENICLFCKRERIRNWKNEKKKYNLIGIYLITNPQNKKYIGKSNNIKKRWKWYEGLYKDEQPKLYNSFLKYGVENHKFETLEQCSEERLDEREVFWKLCYLEEVNYDWGKVLFINLLDSGGGTFSKETCDKISKAKTGFKHSKESIEKIRKGNLGKKVSEETKQRMRKPKPEGFRENISNANKGKSHPTKYKPILQYDLENNFIQEWISIKEAKKKFKGDIGACCLGKQKTSAGYVWKYKNN